MLEQIINSTLSSQVIVLILSALPLSELRGSIPVGIGLLNMSWYQVLILSIIGNLLPVPFIIRFLDTFSNIISKNNHGKRFMEWLYTRIRKQTASVEKYHRIGLIIFVAIPLPGTGAWTASILAHLLGIKFSHALLDITLGVIGAGIIVTVLVLMGWIGAIITIIGISTLVVLSLKHKFITEIENAE